MMSPSIISCKDKIIKYSNNNIIFFDDNDNVYKQFPFNKFKWINEINANSLNHPNIIQFKNCEIIDDFIVDPHNKEIYLDQKEKVVRLTMNKYQTTLNQIYDFIDDDILYIFKNLLSANIHCNTHNIIHRDIKESNILIDYINFTEKTRIITKVVLADFNISRYRYDISELNKYKIMTITHRPPEIAFAILNSKWCNYDERVDVWSLCVVLSYLITGKSFYSFLTDGYLKIDPTILFDADKLIIAMNHFIKIFEKKSLMHLKFYKKIIFMGIASYENRLSFTYINTYMYKYTQENNVSYSTPHIVRHINIDIIHNSVPSRTRTIDKKSQNTSIKKTNHKITDITPTNYTKDFKNIIITNIHNEMKNHNLVMQYFQKLYCKMSYNNFEFSNISIISLYILSALLVTDESIIMDDYIVLINKVMDEKLTKNSIELTIIKIIKFNDFTLN